MKNLRSSLLIIVIASIASIVSCSYSTKKTDHLNLESKLSGRWMAQAFDGELHEQWTLERDGWMHQQGYYIEQRDTTYAAKTQIQKVGEELILFSVIKNSNPKIFKSILVEDDKIVFKNDDYKNPYEVTYEFISEFSYKRTIKGYENDSLVQYEFNFEKRN